jgi:hypothetical protein
MAKRNPGTRIRLLNFRRASGRPNEEVLRGGTGLYGDAGPEMMRDLQATSVDRGFVRDVPEGVSTG